MATPTSDFAAHPQFNNRSYAEALKFRSISSSSQLSTKHPQVHHNWKPAADFTYRCYRCRGRGHQARVCRDPIRCFRCGLFGHKQRSCSSPSFSNSAFSSSVRCRDSSSKSGASLAQAWSSMIYHDDASIRNSDYSQEEIDEERFNFNLNYLRLRKNLILTFGAEAACSVRLLDGLFNSNYKACTIAELLLDETSEDLVDCVLGEEVLNPSFVLPDEFCGSSLSSSVRDMASLPDDVLLSDPVVEHCRFTPFPFHPPLVPTIDGEAPCAYQSSGVISALLCNDVPGNVGTDDKTIYLGKACNLVSVNGSLVCTDLALCNSFEALDLCFDEGNSEYTSIICYKDPLEFPLSFCTEVNVDVLRPEGVGMSTYHSCKAAVTSTEMQVPSTSVSGELCLVRPEPDLLYPMGLERRSVIASHAATDFAGGSNFGVAGNVTLNVLPVAPVPNCAAAIISLKKKEHVPIYDDNADCSGLGTTVSQGGGNDYLFCPLDSPCVGVGDSCVDTPPSGKRRGGKRKGFYDCSVVRRSARLGGSCDRTVFTSGSLPYSGAVGTTDSGTDC